MPTKPRKLSELDDAELAAEMKRRKAANRPRKVRVFEMDEDTFKKHFGEQDEEDSEDEEEDEEEDEPAGKGGYFS